MKQLVKRAMSGDRDAFATLIELNTQSMYKVARGFLRSDEDVADAIGETILTCFEKLDTLREARYFKTWMIRVLINKCNSILKDNKRQCLLEEFPDIESKDSNIEYMEFIELLDKLDEKYRAIIILYYVEGFKISEISELLDLNENTVKTRLVRGRKSLQKEYQGEVITVKEAKLYAK